MGSSKIEKVNVVPFPYIDSTDILPPKFSQILLEMLSPSPNPP